VLTVLSAGLAVSSLVTLAALGVVGRVAVLVLGIAAVCAGAGQVRALRAASRDARELPGAGTLAVVADRRVDAYAVPGRVVVSTGMLAALAPDERRVLFAHEFAHLAGRHHVFRVVVRAASAANPLLWPVRNAVWYTTERWADERAADIVGDRVAAARVIGKVALASGGGPAARMGIGSVRPGPVPRRVAALLRPPPRPGLVLVAAALGLLLSSASSADDLVSDLAAHGRPADVVASPRG
jgi:hypothetical protein